MTTPNQQTVYAALQAAAAREAQPGESPEQAFVRYLATPTGHELYAAYRAAPPAPPSLPPPPRPAVSATYADAMLKVIDQVAARLQRADPALTHEQAVSEAVQADPQLYQDYLSAKKADARIARMDLRPAPAPRPAAPPPTPRPAATPAPPAPTPSRGTKVYRTGFDADGIYRWMLLGTSDV